MRESGVRVRVCFRGLFQATYDDRFERGLFRSLSGEFGVDCGSRHHSNEMIGKATIVNEDNYHIKSITYSLPDHIMFVRWSHQFDVELIGSA